MHIVQLNIYQVTFPIPNILFDTLYDNKKFQALKSHFLFLNIIQNNKSESKTFMEELESRVIKSQHIVTSYFEQYDVYAQKEENASDDWNEIDFEIHYVIPAIENIPSYYEYECSKFLYSNRIFAKDSKLGFFKAQLLRLQKDKEMLLEMFDDRSQLHQPISEAILECTDYLLDQIDELNDMKLKKIPFTLNQSKLLSFFSLLHRNNWIDKTIERDDLSPLLSRYFLYDRDKSMGKIRTKFSNKYKRSSTNIKAEEKLEESLLQIFQNN